MENYVEKINWEKYKKTIVIEKAMFNTVPKSYLYKKELDDVKDMLDHFDNEKDSKGEAISRNISIAGERGSGKTSFLKSLKNILSKEYHVFDIIGPELLSSNLGITTIFLSMLNTLLEERSKDIDSNLNKFSIVKKQMKQATAAISVEKQQDDYFKNGNAESEILRALTDRVRLDEVMAKLLKEIKELIKEEGKEKKDFVLIIDDLDLVKNSQVSQLLLEIQRYLDKKVIIIFAYRERQLENSLFEDRFNDSRNLINQKIIDNDEIYSQIEQFLVKLVPYGNRIKLYSQDDVLKSPITKILSSLEILGENHYVVNDNFRIVNSKSESLNLTVEEWFYKYIHRHTDLYIKPVDTREDTHQFLPRSLRELIQCFEMFDRMELPSRDVNIINFLTSILDNLDILRRYKNFKIESYFSSDRKKIDYFEEWEASQSYRRNKLTYDFVFYNYSGTTVQNSLESSYPFNLSKSEEYNITLGDILSLIENCKYLNVSSFQTNESYFFYLIKLNYSIYLSKLFIEFTREYQKSKKHNEQMLESYLQVINTKFMPSKFNYLSNNVKWDKDDYILIADSNAIESSKKKAYEQFINQFYYSDVSAEGEIRTHIERSHIERSHFDSRFRFRELYNYKNIAVTNGDKYMFDFFVACNKEKYIKIAIEKFEDGSIKPFIFKNIFQVDLFIRKNYFSSKIGAFEYALRRVNDIIKGKKGEKESLLDFKSLETILYPSESDISSFVNFGPLYNVEEISSIYKTLKKLSMRLPLRAAIAKMRRVLEEPIRAQSYESLSEEIQKFFRRYNLDVNSRIELYDILNQISSRDITNKTVLQIEYLFKQLKDTQYIKLPLRHAITKISNVLEEPIRAQSYESLLEEVEGILARYNLDVDDRMELNDIINQIILREITNETVWQISRLFKKIKSKEGKVIEEKEEKEEKED